MRPRRQARGALALALAAAVLLPLGAPTAAEAAALPPPVAGAEVYPRPATGVFTLTGGGYGHGIGMSQYGANGAAAAGLDVARILAFYYPGTQFVPGGKPFVRIGITVDNDGITQVGARPGLRMRAGGTTVTLPTAPLQWRVLATRSSATSCVVQGFDGARWTAYRPGATPCPVVFSAPERSVDLVLPSGVRRVYRGSIEAVRLGTTRLTTVNTVSTESYLRSVVAAEMPPSFRAEALKAQAVAARTIVAQRLKGTAAYDTCDTTACQVYSGAGTRRTDGTIARTEYPSTDAAVVATSGKILTFRFADGVTRVATAMFSSSNGGYAADAPGVAWHTYLKAHADPYDAVAGNSRATWTASVPATSLEATFGIAWVERVQILARDGDGRWGGRVTQMLIEGRTATGAYRSVATTGNGFAAARPWPTYPTGVSSNYFTINR